MMNIRIIGMTLTVALGVGVGIPAAQQPQGNHSATTATQTVGGDPYLLGADPVSGKPLGDTAVIHQHEGRELRFTDRESLETFKADPAKHLPAIDREMIQRQLAHYPLDACLVAGQKLGSMGEPVNRIYRNRLVRLCCAGCVDSFEKYAATFLAKLDAAVVEKQRANYPTDKCIVSGDKLGGDMGEPFDLVVGNRLVRLCCKGCIAEFLKTPAAHIAKLDAASNPNNAGDRDRAADKDGKTANDPHAGHGR